MASGEFTPAMADMVAGPEDPPPHPASAPATRAPRSAAFTFDRCRLVNPCFSIGGLRTKGGLTGRYHEPDGIGRRGVFANRPLTAASGDCAVASPGPQLSQPPQAPCALPAD